MKITDFLLPGKENAITARQLADVMGVKETRSISLMVERERKSGVPVCATSDPACPGYYVAASAAELAEYLTRLDRRIHNVSQSRARLGDTLAEMTGQQKLSM